MKIKRNVWIFIGICFMIGFWFAIVENHPSTAYKTLTGMNCVLSFAAAYKFHRKIA